MSKLSTADPEPRGFVLGHRGINTLFVRLTFTKRRRPQWEFTDDFNACNKFSTQQEADDAMHAHRCPISQIRVRPHINAFNDWLQAQPINQIDE